MVVWSCFAAMATKARTLSKSGWTTSVSTSATWQAVMRSPSTASETMSSSEVTDRHT